MQVVAKCVTDTSANELVDAMQLCVRELLQIGAADSFQSSDILIALTQIYKLQFKWISHTLDWFPWKSILSLIPDPFQPFEIQKRRSVLIATILQNYSTCIGYVI